MDIQQIDENGLLIDKYGCLEPPPDNKVCLFGKIFDYEFIPSKKTYLQIENQKILIFTSKKTPDLKYVLKVIKTYSKEFLIQRTFMIASLIYLAPREVKVRTLNCSYGLCYINKSIVLNWKLIFYELSMIDCIIFHELCHLQHLNHNKKFWNLLFSLFPDYNSISKKMRKYSKISDYYGDIVRGKKIWPFLDI